MVPLDSAGATGGCSFLAKKKRECDTSRHVSGAGRVVKNIWCCLALYGGIFCKLINCSQDQSEGIANCLAHFGDGWSKKPICQGHFGNSSASDVLHHAPHHHRDARTWGLVLPVAECVTWGGKAGEWHGKVSDLNVRKERENHSWVITENRNTCKFYLGWPVLGSFQTFSCLRQIYCPVTICWGLV